MDVVDLVKGSAKVITITTLSPGDVVKVVEESTYTKAKIKMGVVVDVLNNGEKAAIELVFVDNSYSTPSLETRVITAETKDLALFAAKPKDFRAHVDGCLGAMQHEIEKKTEELEAQKRAWDRLSGLLESTKANALTAPQVKLLEG
jgi:hypothetical protein